MIYGIHHSVAIAEGIEMAFVMEVCAEEVYIIFFYEVMGNIEWALSIITGKREKIYLE